MSNNLYVGMNGDIASGYEWLEYIESSGTQFIETDIHLSLGANNFKMEVDFQLLEDSDDGIVAGVNLGSSKGFYVSKHFNTETHVWAEAKLGGAYSSKSGQALNERHTVAIDGNETVIYWDGVSTNPTNPTTRYSSNFSDTNISDMKYIKFFGGYDYFSDSVKCSSVKIFSAKIYTYFSYVSSGGNIIGGAQLSGAYYPCRRKSDGILGMYDTVNDVFYTNSGTGEFIAGPIVGVAHKVKIVYVGVDDVARKVMKIYAGDSNNKAKTIWKRDFRLDYQQVEYIQGTGTQYINCGNVIDSQTRIEAVFQLTSTSTSVTGYFIGGMYDTSNRLGVCLNTNGNLILGVGKGYHGRSANTNKHTAVLNSPGKAVSLDGTSRSATSGSYSSVVNAPWMGILGGLSSGGITYCGKVKVYHVQLRSGGASGTIVHDYYPVYRKSDNEPGVYDIVEGKFYGNSGTGTIGVGSNYEVDL